MNNFRHSLILIFLLLIPGCGDAPFYYTPLPRGLEHVSNGGELGWIGEPTVSDSWTPVYPTENDWFCNEFAIVGNDVIGKEIVYAVRAFVEPPVKKRWFYLDTSNNTATTFQSLVDLQTHCNKLGHTEIPELVTRTDRTSRR